MSLALVQGYSSEEEVQERFPLDSDTDGTDDEDAAVPVEVQSKTRLTEAANHANEAANHPNEVANHPNGSLLPSAADVFSEVTGPPDFLKNSVTDPIAIRRRPHATTNMSQKYSQELQRLEELQTRKEPPVGAIVEARPQLVGMHERVRSDKENTQEEPRRLPSAGLPPAEDAAKLLRVCLQCGVPKTYSAAKEGMVCPVCNDRPAVDAEIEAYKKRGSKIKDKERNKRMKGQSSHATWKSETEMHLRQQFD